MLSRLAQLFTGYTGLNPWGGIIGYSRERGTRSDTRSRASSTLAKGNTTIILKQFWRIVDRIKNHKYQESTRLAYHNQWVACNQFLLRFNNLPEDWGDRLVLYAAALAEDGKAPATIKTYISGIRQVLLLDKVQFTDRSFELKAIVRASKLENNKIYVRMPITKQILKGVLKQLAIRYDQQPYLQAMYRAMCVAAYYGMLRIGEITGGKHSLKAQHVIRTRQKIGGKVVTGVRLYLRSSKTHGIGDYPQAVDIRADSHDSIDPVTILGEFAAMRDEFGETIPEFFVFKDGTPVSALQYRRVLKEMLKNAGYQPGLYNAHSTRKGRAQDLFKLNWDIEAIKRQGRWSPSSLCIYNYLREMNLSATRQY